MLRVGGIDRHELLHHHGDLLFELLGGAVVVEVVGGVVLWGVQRLPIDAAIKNIIRVVGIIAAVIILIRLFV